MFGLTAAIITYFCQPDTYSEISYANGITTTNVAITVPANSTVVKQSTLTVTGSSEPCQWRSLLSALFDDAWTSTLVNTTSVAYNVTTTFKSGNAGNSFRSDSNPANTFTRERTEWVYGLLRDAGGA